MEVLYFVIPLALLLGGGFIAAFAWATRSGQFEDLQTPGFRVLFGDEGDDGE